MFEYIHHVAYAVEDIDAAIGIFRDIFELEFVDRRVVEGDQSFEMATFRCGASIIELQRPINSPRVAQFLKDHGPGLLHVAYAVKNLPEREQFVMSMYYEHDMNLKEIAAVLKVTESRVCQLHSQSIARLRSKLRAW